MSLKVLILLILSLLSFSSLAGVNIIYGDDDRVDPASSLNSMHKMLARSTAAMVSRRNLKSLNSEQVIFEGQYKAKGICERERFFKQPKVADCSGFLVSKNKIVTAGHCVSGSTSENVWVFDYAADYEDQSQVVVDKKNIYRAKRIISRQQNVWYGDYAVIDIEKQVPLQLETIYLLLGIQQVYLQK